MHAHRRHQAIGAAVSARRQALFPILDGFAALLRPADSALLQALLASAADYFLLVYGAPPGPSAAESAFADRPPGTRPEDKHLLGLFDHAGALIGVLDAVRDYPQPGTWWLGLLLLAPEHRGRGLGTQAYFAFERWAARLGARAIGLGIVEGNERACRFWRRIGFAPGERRPPAKFGEREHVVLVMVRSLAP